VYPLQCQAFGANSSGRRQPRPRTRRDAPIVRLWLSRLKTARALFAPIAPRQQAGGERLRRCSIIQGAAGAEYPRRNGSGKARRREPWGCSSWGNGSRFSSIASIALNTFAAIARSTLDLLLDAPCANAIWNIEGRGRRQPELAHCR
jgi:hypothetical protein